MTVNLLEVLSQEDKIRIENYIKLYGTKNGFIGVDEWLQDWAKNNFRLYHFLGDQLIYKIPYCYEKPATALKKELDSFKDSIKSSIFFDFCNDNFFVAEGICPIVYDFVTKCLNYRSLERDAADYSIKIKLPGKRKTFQIQGEAKPLRSLAKFLNYCKDCGDQEFQDRTKELIEVVDNLVVRYSQIYNDKMLRGNLVLSIHPLDFITMSDNSLNWRSCMNWTNGGCYRVGTIEMMNSNNVICCYLESSNDLFSFGKDEDKDNPLYQWSNKKWRQLIYLTKDIIVTGKPYPYVNEELSKQILEVARDLAKKNLHWTYSFGPELYKDMKYINSTFSMERAKRFIRMKSMKKHNIIFDTKGMYNDMLNDSFTNYWCVRNKVPHNKVISYSGKAPCLCCGESILTLNDEYCDDYNDRYYSTKDVVCSSCLDSMRCSLCGDADPRMSSKIIYKNKGLDREEMRICEECEKNYFFKCPCCGRSFFFSDFYDVYRRYDYEYHTSAFIKLSEEISHIECHPRNTFERLDAILTDDYFKTVLPVFMCNDCLFKDDRFELVNIEIPLLWGGGKMPRSIYLSKRVYGKSDWDPKYFTPIPAELSEKDFLKG